MIARGRAFAPRSLRKLLPTHRLALACATLHLAICAAMAAATGTFVLVLAVGVPAVLVPAWLALRYPRALLSRLAMAAGFMALTVLVIQQSGGDNEAHFSFFVMMSVLVVYNDWRPLVAAFGLLVLHHLAFTLLQPVAIGFYVWNDDRNLWGHLAIHVVVGAAQTLALCHLADMLRQRHALEAENAALGRSLRHASERASRDPLTGLHNRRHLDLEMPILAGLVASGAASAVVCVIDLDHFKLVNDRFGHAAGDDVLKAVAETITAELRPEDWAVRQGGEEFVVVLRDLPEGEAVRFSERIRARIAVRPVQTEIGPIAVTASVGVASWETGTDFDIAFGRADQALYRAKHRGRNRVELVTALDGVLEAGFVRAA